MSLRGFRNFVPRSAKSRMRRTETAKPIWIKFCMVVHIPDVVNYTNLGDHRLMGFWVAGGGSNFPISHRLSSSPLQHSRSTVRVSVWSDQCISYSLAKRIEILSENITNFWVRMPCARLIVGGAFEACCVCTLNRILAFYLLKLGNFCFL